MHKNVLSVCTIWHPHTNSSTVFYPFLQSSQDVTLFCPICARLFIQGLYINHTILALWVSLYDPPVAS